MIYQVKPVDIYRGKKVKNLVWFTSILKLRQFKGVKLIKLIISSLTHIEMWLWAKQRDIDREREKSLVRIKIII